MSTAAASELAHVRWIGGGSGGGKSTVARRLADRFELLVYDTDVAMADHAARATRDDAPELAAFLAMDMDERWLDRDPQVMLETFHWFRGEGFELILEDLHDLPADRPVLADGFRLLPRLVAPLLTRPADAVWLLPTRDFRRRAFEERGTLWSIAGRTSDPERALTKLLERDRLFTDWLNTETQALDLNTIVVDGSQDEDSLVDHVARLFGLETALDGSPERLARSCSDGRGPRV